jgi:chemotaxis regulatin CheY-phosphate phosphatase CheZ
MPERALKSAQSLQQTSTAPKPGLAEDYAALEATLRASPLGRWFLAEYVRRNRTPETQLLLDAIARLEVAVLKPQRQAGSAKTLAELTEISEEILRTRREVAELRPPVEFEKHLSEASEELDQIVGATEKATSEILSAAEDVQEVAWTLREKGVESEFCDRLDQHAVDIYTACLFQDITGQRTAKVVRTLRHVEDRINAMIGAGRAKDAGTTMGGRTSPIHDSALLNGPPGDGEGLDQSDVDTMMGQRHEPPAGRLGRAAAPDGPEGEPFERPEPLTLSRLHAAKRAALFG